MFRECSSESGGTLQSQVLQENVQRTFLERTSRGTPRLMHLHVFLSSARVSMAARLPMSGPLTPGHRLGAQRKGRVLLHGEWQEVY